MKTPTIFVMVLLVATATAAGNSSVTESPEAPTEHPAHVTTRGKGVTTSLNGARVTEKFEPDERQNNEAEEFERGSGGLDSNPSAGNEGGNDGGNPAEETTAASGANLAGTFVTVIAALSYLF